MNEDIPLNISIIKVQVTVQNRNFSKPMGTEGVSSTRGKILDQCMEVCDTNMREVRCIFLLYAVFSIIMTKEVL